jgi:hypothetical protein
MPPPKRILKSGLTKSKPQTIIQSNNEQNKKDSDEADLQFDQEVLWCISQFEILIKSGKLSDAKSKFNNH